MAFPIFNSGDLILVEAQLSKGRKSYLSELFDFVRRQI